MQAKELATERSVGETLLTASSLEEAAGYALSKTRVKKEFKIKPVFGSLLSRYLYCNQLIFQGVLRLC